MKFYMVYILLQNLIFIVSGFTSDSRTIKAKQAMCMPELQVVPVKENPDHLSTYFPSCIRIKRCGGCCNHELLSCQPTHSEVRYYEVQVIKLNNDLIPIENFTEIVQLEEHTACKCDCKRNGTETSC